MQCVVEKTFLFMGTMHNTNNIVEASIRISKNIVLERYKAFNAAALVDFVFEVFEIIIVSQEALKYIFSYHVTWQNTQ